MDHDYVFQNDFAGEAYVHMADVPGVDGDEITGFEALNVKSLPLMQPKHKGEKNLEISSISLVNTQIPDFSASIKKKSCHITRVTNGYKMAENSFTSLGTNERFQSLLSLSLHSPSIYSLSVWFETLHRRN